MKKSNTVCLVVFLTVFMFLVFFPTTMMAALPFTLKKGHPRVYLDQARIDDVIKPAVRMELPLNGANFPQQAGTLSFDLYVSASPKNSNINNGLIDDYDPTRNHIYVRHGGEHGTYSPSGASDKAVVEIGFQAVGNRFDNRKFFLIPNTWHTVTIYWNATIPRAGAVIDAGTSQETAWSVPATSIPSRWTPSAQKFIFGGRGDRFDNIKLYANDTADAASLIASYPLDEGRGAYTADISGHGHAARLGSDVIWTTRSTIDTNPVIQINGVVRPFTIIADSPLTDSWSPLFHEQARWRAHNLNRGATVNNIETEQGDGIAGHARILGIEYLVTGDPQFKTALLKYADQILAVKPRVDAKGNIIYPGSDDSQSGRVEALGIIYDWLYDVVTTQHRSDGDLYSDDIAKHIKAEVSAFNLRQAVCGGGNKFANDWTCVTASVPSKPVRPNPIIVGHPHHNNAQISAAIIAIIDEHPELRNLLVTLYNNFSSVYNPALAWYCVDGGHPYGWDYGAGYTFLDPILLWQNAGASMAAQWQSKLIYRYIYGLRGDFSYPASGDTFSTRLSSEYVAAQALWAAVRSGDGHAQFYFDRWIKPYLGNGSIAELLYSLPSAQPRPLPVDDLPYSRLFRNAGQVLMRDAWDYPNATLLEFKSTSFRMFNHQHMDENAFTLFYRAPLLIDSGYYDTYGSVHWHNYYTRTIAHNTITVFDPNESFVKRWWDPSDPLKDPSWWPNDGGQYFGGVPVPTLRDLQSAGPNHFDGVTAYEYHPDFTYTVGNASKAYDPAKLDQTNGFVRSIVFLRNPSFWGHPITLLFDKVTTQPDKAEIEKRFVLHTVNEPLSAPGDADGDPTMGTRLPGQTVVIRNGGGMVFLQTLLPENAILIKRGGGDSRDPSTDYRFLVPDKFIGKLTNYPPKPDPGPTARDMGAWRVEVTSSVNARREYFLHVLSVADYGAVEAPPSALNLTSSSAAVVLLAGTQLVAFNKSDKPASYLSWDMPFAEPKMIIAGLIPGASYAGKVVANDSTKLPYTYILRNDTKGTLKASSEGVLVINAGHLLSLNLPTENAVSVH